MTKELSECILESESKRRKEDNLRVINQIDDELEKTLSEAIYKKQNAIIKEYYKELFAILT